MSSEEEYRAGLIAVAEAYTREWLSKRKEVPVEKEAELNTVPFFEPVPMLLNCPKCGYRHIDQHELATKSHHTHACQKCGVVWRPAIGPTVGVLFLPGFQDPLFPREQGASEQGELRSVEDIALERDMPSGWEACNREFAAVDTDGCLMALWFQDKCRWVPHSVRPDYVPSTRNLIKYIRPIPESHREDAILALRKEVLAVYERLQRLEKCDLASAYEDLANRVRRLETGVDVEPVQSTPESEAPLMPVERAVYAAESMPTGWVICPREKAMGVNGMQQAMLFLTHSLQWVRVDVDPNADISETHIRFIRPLNAEDRAAWRAGKGAGHGG